MHTRPDSTRAPSPPRPQGRERVNDGSARSASNRFNRSETPSRSARPAWASQEGQGPTPPPPPQVAEFGDSLCPEGARHHQSDNFGVGSLVCLDGRGTLFPTPSFITLIKRPRVSTHPANTAARRERPETAARPGGLSDWLRGSPAIFLPWPLTLIPFGKIRLLADGFQYQLPSAVLPLPFLSTS